MMNSRSFPTLLLCLCSSISAFPLSPPSLSSSAIGERMSKKTSVFALGVSASLSNNDKDLQSLLSKAWECGGVDDEVCSLEESEEYLDAVLRFQQQDQQSMGSPSSSAVSAVFAPVSHGSRTIRAMDEIVSEIVSRLTHRIQLEKGIVAESYESGPTTTTLSSAPVAGILLIALFSTFVLSYAKMGVHTEPGVVSFTYQEFWWAVKGGYLDDMIHHYIRNGGL